MKKNKIKHFRSLRVKFIAAVIAFALILSAAICVADLYNGYMDFKERTKRYLFVNMQWTSWFGLTNNEQEDLLDLSYINSDADSEEYKKFKYADTAKEELNFTRMYIFSLDDDGKGYTYIYEAGDSVTKAKKGDRHEFTAAELEYLLPPLKSDGMSRHLDEKNMHVTGWMNISNHNYENVGYLGIEISLKDAVFVFLKEMKLHLLVSFAVIAAASIVLTIFLSRAIVYPIRHLVKQTKEFISGDSLHYISKINTGDEIQLLGDSLSDMAESIEHYTLNLQNDATEKERISTEMRIAQSIEKSLMPSPIEVSGLFSVAGLHKSFKGIGGSFYDFFMIDDLRLCVVNAQVSALGAHMGMCMTVAITMVKSHMMTAVKLEDAVKMLNSQLYETFRGETTLSVFIGVLEIPTGDFSFINAGNTNAFTMHGGGSYETVKKRISIPLAKEKNVSYKQIDIKLRSGDRVLLCTENLTRVKGRKGEFYDDNKMCNLLKKDFCKKSNAQSLVHFFDYELFLNTEQNHTVPDVAFLSLQYDKLNKDRNEMVVSPKAENLETILALVKEQLKENGISGTFYAETIVSVEELFVIAMRRSSGYGITVRCFVSEKNAEIKFLYGGKLANPLETNAEIELDAIGFITNHGGNIKYESADRNNILSLIKMF